MTYENILTERRDDGVGIVRLNRPKQYNALNGALMRELTDALLEHDADPAIRCHLITGDDRAFAAGADIKEMAELSAVEMFQRDTISLWDKLTRLKKPLIAAVSGFCLGGGMELAMACDMIVASETAKFGQPEVTIGVIPGAGGTQRLPRAIGKALAMEMILNNRSLSATEAAQFGLVNRVYPIEAYFNEALKLAAEIAARAPLAVQAAKEAINKALETPLSEGIAYERRAFYFLFATEDQKEGMAAFVGKRDPKWQGK
ncbi:MAG: enoyl-CoA hydratase/isomerase family protein [Anaerolineae bacterium]|nr:enoyl-CoA hydratase/isomerase family protein [Anaerolineae bacterium]